MFILAWIRPTIPYYPRCYHTPLYQTAKCNGLYLAIFFYAMRSKADYMICMRILYLHFVSFKRHFHSLAMSIIQGQKTLNVLKTDPQISYSIVHSRLLLAKELRGHGKLRGSESLRRSTVTNIQSQYFSTKA